MYRTKSFPIKQFPNIQFRAGTENKDPLKACYLEMRGTFETTNEEKKKAFDKVCRKITNAVNNTIDTRKFRQEFIMVKDVSDSFVLTGRSYTKIELTFFLKREMEIDEVTDELNRISTEIWRNALQDSDQMKFHKQLISKRKYK